MPFINDILRHRSVSIVGLEKNTGKTECLNYILRRIPSDSVKLAVTSIGIDGETTDQVTSTSKPEITLGKGVWFGTSEKHYRQRKMLCELWDVSDESTAIGRVVTAKALQEGKILLSGPSSGSSLKRWMNSLDRFDLDLILVDGALSRLSTASPAISEAMVLSTGAAFSANIRDLVSKTAYIVELIGLPVAQSAPDVRISSFQPLQKEIFRGEKVIEVEGALTDRLLQAVRSELSSGSKEIVVNDFTRVFATQENYRQFIRMGGKISVRMRSDLLAITVNPKAPNGMVLDSDILCGTLSEAVGLPVYDIVKNNYLN